MPPWNPTSFYNPNNLQRLPYDRRKKRLVPGSADYMTQYGAGTGWDPYGVGKPITRGLPTGTPLNPLNTGAPRGGRRGTTTTTKKTTPVVAPQKTGDPWADYLAELDAREAAARDAAIRAQQQSSLSYMGALAGFGQALQGSAADAWNRINEGTFRGAAEMGAYQDSVADSYYQGLVGANDQIARDYAAIGQSGDPQADPNAVAQVRSVGGENPAGTMGLVGKAWASYGKTVPGTVGFMTEQNLMQAQRDALKAEQDIRVKFAEAMADNPQQAMQMWAQVQQIENADREFKENQRQYGLDYALKVRDSRRQDIALNAQLTELGIKKDAAGQADKQVDASASKAIGYLVDQMGRPIYDKKGKLQPVVGSPVGVNEIMSANNGYVTDKNGQPVYDANGNVIPYQRRPGIQGGTGSNPKAPTKGKPGDASKAWKSFRSDVDDVIYEVIEVTPKTESVGGVPGKPETRSFKQAPPAYADDKTGANGGWTYASMTRYITSVVNQRYPGLKPAKKQAEILALVRRAWQKVKSASGDQTTVSGGTTKGKPRVGAYPNQ